MELKFEHEPVEVGLPPLLIVPCGIEISYDPDDIRLALKLLIVPCGIEIKYNKMLLVDSGAFNRTIWN